jgi:myo-inositol-1-phosphate synthase
VASVEPIGSLALMDTIRLGKRTEGRHPYIKDFVPLADLDDIVFGAWDPFPDDAYVAATRAGVLDGPRHIEAIADALREVRPMPAAFDRSYVKNIDADNVLGTVDKRAMLEAIRADINRFRDEKKIDRLVMLWAASTEVYIEPGPTHMDLESFEAAIDANDHTIAPVDAVRLRRHPRGCAVRQRGPEPGCRHARAAPAGHRAQRGHQRQGLQDRSDAHEDRARPMLKARMLGLAGWYSTNILGNRDGEVLDDPENFKTKEESKLGVLEHILHPDQFPELYGNVFHKVRINYYPPRGDNKEGWDNIDIFGWLGYPMQIKVDFLCRDSILAAPLALDLVLFSDLAQRAGLGGIQEWLSFYYKSPQVAPGLYPEHDLFIQLTKLKNTLRWMMGEDQITHLGREYYDEN